MKDEGVKGEEGVGAGAGAGAGAALEQVDEDMEKRAERAGSADEEDRRD